MVTIKYLSAADRINYGDLLFPIVFQHYFKVEDGYEVINYGLVSSDYSNFGAIPTKSYRDLRRNNRSDDIIVVGGGEVFFGSWEKLLAFISPTFDKLYKRKLFKALADKLKIARIALGGGDSISPFLPELKGNTIYIAAGGQFNNAIPSKKLNRIIGVLNKSLFLSVRDGRTFDSLVKNNVKQVNLVPDTAVLISKIFPLHELSLKIEVNGFNHVTKKSYIFLQIGKTKGPDDLETFVKRLAQVAKSKQLEVVCAPIGISPGHEDHVLLEKLVEISDDWRFIMPKSIFETMYLIASSSMYIGTSLHGAITAFAYNLPIVPLNIRIKKLDSFVDTWCNDFYIRSIDFDNIIEGVERSFQKWSPERALTKLSEMQVTVEDNIMIVKELIENRGLK